MASEDRRSTRDLTAEICDDAPRFRFFQAVRLLALAGPAEGNAGVPQHVRFKTPLSLGFPASEILGVRRDYEARHAGSTLPGLKQGEDCALVNASEPAIGSARDSEIDNEIESESDTASSCVPLQLTVGFMGLTGPSGVLPTAYTESLIERRNVYRDTTAHQFLDIFSHRAVSLFYSAWRKYRFHIAYEAGDRDGFSRNILDLVGVGLGPLQSRLQHAGGVPDMFLARFAGILSRRPVPASQLAAVLRAYFEVDVEVEQFAGHWMKVPQGEQSSIGNSGCSLSGNSFVGERYWDRQYKIGLRIGPLDESGFSDFLPGEPGFLAAAELVRFCAGTTLACDTTLILKKDAVPFPILGNRKENGLRLGYNTWLRGLGPVDHQDDTRFSLLD